MLKFILLIIPFILYTQTTSAQNSEIGILTGITTYNGDINVRIRNLKPALQPAVGIVCKYPLSDNFLLRGQVLMGKLSSSEKNYPYAWRRVRGFAFVSNFTEISSVVEWDLLNIKKLSAYVFAGVGATIFSPKTDFNEPNPYINSDFNPDAKAHFKKITPAIPIGGGLKYHFTPNLCLSVEMGSRILFTDYIDGISILGNPKRRDTYFVTATTLTKTWGSSKSSANRSYRLGRNICPTF